MPMHCYLPQYLLVAQRRVYFRNRVSSTCTSIDYLLLFDFSAPFGLHALFQSFRFLIPNLFFIYIFGRLSFTFVRCAVVWILNTDSEGLVSIGDLVWLGSHSLDLGFDISPRRGVRG